MTTEGARAIVEGGAIADGGALPDDDQLFCYRHPARETRIRCGRCDRPICTRCAMQGPVGFRCRQCGTLANDPLRSISVGQAALGLVVAIGLGAVAGLVASRIGFFSIIVSFFAGGLIAGAVTRLIGYKRGPTILAMILGGITAGTAGGYGIDYLIFWAEFSSIPIPAEVGVELPVGSFLVDTIVWALVSAGAACFGAYSRLR